MDTITLGAFARSGNHYFQHLVDTALISVRCVWLSHRMSDWHDRINRVTIVRDPADCVTSWISTTGDMRSDRASRVLEWYLAYHETIISTPDISIVRFDDLITHPLAAINKVCDDHGLSRSFFSSDQTLLAACDLIPENTWPNPDHSHDDEIRAELAADSLWVHAQSIYRRLSDLSLHQ